MLKNISTKYLPCGTEFLREFMLAVGHFLCFVGTNFCDKDRLFFFAGNL